MYMYTKHKLDSAIYQIQIEFSDNIQNLGCPACRQRFPMSMNTEKGQEELGVCLSSLSNTGLFPGAKGIVGKKELRVRRIKGKRNLGQEELRVCLSSLSNTGLLPQHSPIIYAFPRKSLLLCKPLSAQALCNRHRCHKMLQMVTDSV